MKFLLIIQICSALIQQCTEPVEIYPLYSSHYDCATGGFLRGITVVREIGEEEVNNKNILVNFACIKQESI
jgi:hypothetical protein